jgi:hypothetical protein
MVYLAAGVSGFTSIIETFFIKDQLGLSAAFLPGWLSGPICHGRLKCPWVIWSIFLAP